MFQQEVYDHFNKVIVENGQNKEKEWKELFTQYKNEFPELGKQFETAIHNELPEGWSKDLPVYEEGKSLASRASSGEVIECHC